MIFLHSEILTECIKSKYLSFPVIFAITPRKGYFLNYNHKTYLRNSIFQEKLTYISILYIEKLRTN